MLDNKDYSKLTLEELLIEEKKIKKKKTFSAFGTGLLIGVMVYGIAQNSSGIIYILLPLLLIYGNYKNSQKIEQNLKQVQAEINAKNS